MKIYVCVKQVPDTSGKVAVNPDGTLNQHPAVPQAACAVNGVDFAQHQGEKHPPLNRQPL